MAERSPLNQFQAALLEAQILDLEEILSQYPEDIPVSRKHERAMARILRGKRPISRRVIAILVAAAIALLAGCAAFVTRRRIADFLEELSDDHSKVMIFEPTETSPDSIEDCYTLTYVPDGYTIDSTTMTPLFRIEKWVNGSEEITFEQQLLSTHYFYDTEQSEDYQHIVIDSVEYYYRQAGGFHQYLWTDENYLYSIMFSENFKQEIVIQILNGIDVKS